MEKLRYLVIRNTKLFFKDKGMFFTAMITPLILLVLYVTFLGNVYRDSFVSGMPEGFVMPEKLLNGIVGGQLLSSLLAVCCVTVAFCSNLLMVQDKVSGARDDLCMTTVKGSTLAAGYFISTAISTLLICLVACGAAFIYLAIIGWYLSVADVIMLLVDVVLLVLFGTALSSVINHFLSTQGQMSAVGTIISSCYGFICGAYMPISQFGGTLQKLLSFLPGTYATSIIRVHAMDGAISQLKGLGLPDEVVTQLKDVTDCNIYFFNNAVPNLVKLVVTACSGLLLCGVYVALNIKTKKLK